MVSNLKIVNVRCMACDQPQFSLQKIDDTKRNSDEKKINVSNTTIDHIQLIYFESEIASHPIGARIIGPRLRRFFFVFTPGHILIRIGFILAMRKLLVIIESTTFKYSSMTMLIL